MARIGGAFPLPTAQITEGGYAVALASGAAWYPPAGEYFIIMGANTNFEVWDPNAQQWRQITASPDWTSAPKANHADLCHVPLAICHLPFAISHSLPAICYLL